MWHKLATLFTRAFIRAIQHRAEMVLWLVLDTIPSVILVLVWVSIFNQRGSISGYSLGQIVQYYFLAGLINDVSGSHFEQVRVREIREGKIDFFLIRPFSYIYEIGIVFIATKTFYILVTLPFLTGVWLLLTHAFTLEVAWPSLLQLGQFIGLLGFALVVEFLIALLIVLLGFWLEGAEGLEHFKWLIVTLLSGWMIPVALMPAWLQQIILRLPFRFMYDVPIGIFQGRYQLVFSSLLSPLLFVAGLILIIYFVWRKAVWQYTSVGG